MCVDVVDLPLQLFSPPLPSISSPSLQIVKNERYGYSVDFWSLGVLSYEMLTGQSPFSGDSEEELFDSICNCNVPFPSFLAPSSIDYLKRVSLKIYMIALLKEKEEIALTFDFFVFSCWREIH